MSGNQPYPVALRGRVIIGKPGSIKLFGGKNARKTLLTIILVLLLATALVVFASMALPAVLSGGVKSVVTLEAGFELPPASDFLDDPKGNAVYITDISGLDTRKIGDIPITIAVDDVSHDVILRVVDTTAPSAYPRDIAVVTGETRTAGEFAAYITDACEVSVSFKRQPDFNQQGAHDTIVVLEDTSRNKTELTARLIVFGIKQALGVEAGAPGVEPRDFLDVPAGYEDLQADIEMSFQTGIGRPEIDAPGDYEVVINANGLIFVSTVKVADTSPPTSRPADRTICLGTAAEPSFFIADASDASEFSASFKSTPDFTAIGTQEVTVILEDILGNTSEYTSSLTIVVDTVPPVISGVVNQTVHIGDNVSYRSGVSAYDNVDGDVQVSIESSAVNVQKAGTYSVTYSAADSGGNASVRLSTITVIDLNYDMVYELADQVLAAIITDDMDPAVKVQRIWRWTHDNITYAGTHETETLRGAYSGLRTRRGNCFIYYAVSEVLLNRAGFDTMRATRVGGRTNHFWNLINIGTGWYHYDATPILGTSVNLYMFTSVQAAEYTRRITNNTIYTNYYVFDRSLYPPIVGDDELYGDEGADTGTGGAENAGEASGLEGVPIADPTGNE